MKPAAPRYVPIPVLFAALLVLNGCGGGGDATLSPPPPPNVTEPGGLAPDRCQTANPPDDCTSLGPPADERRGEAIHRAIVAAGDASFAAREAQAACAAVSAACDAAARATDAAVIAQGAADAVRDATTLAEAERTAERAVEAAMTAWDANREAAAILDDIANNPGVCTGPECDRVCPADGSSEDCPPPIGEGLLERAFEAADRASAFADEAQGHCAAESAACDAARMARDAADKSAAAFDVLQGLVLQGAGASEAAERAAAAAVAAAVLARAAAQRAQMLAMTPPTQPEPPVQCPDGSSVSHGTACPPIPPSRTVDWLVPGTTVASDAARDDLLAAGSRVTHSWRYVNSGVCCRHGIERHAEWGYWNEIDLSPDIVKVQRRPAPGTYASHNSDRAMFGILDNGIFWAGRDDDTFGAGYSYGNQFQEDFRDRPDVFYLNATWRGDAFGMEKTTRKFVAGPASLTLESVTRPRFGLPNFDWHLGVSFKNIGADPIDMRFRAGGCGAAIRMRLPRQSG